MSKQTDFDKLDILGVEVDAVSNADAVSYVIGHSVSGRPAGYVVKPYVEFLDRAYHDASVRDLLNGAELSLADGVALTWAAHFLYAGPRRVWRFWLTLFQIVLAPGKLSWPLPDRTAGITFTWPLLAEAATHGRRVYLVGDPKSDTIAHTAETLLKAFPKLVIVGAHSGRDHSQPRDHISDTWLEQLAASIRTANPDIILTGMGFPLQDRVGAYLAAHLDHGLSLGEGGTFDYEAFGGTLPKAPAWTVRLGLEWFWRLLHEPQRLRRQLAIPRFIYRIWRNR
jgi:N-acetylglucosaminyldiphosphoundecaprenol N-acetyl-beta-D-mannosaminyltransferase